MLNHELTRNMLAVLFCVHDMVDVHDMCEKWVRVCLDLYEGLKRKNNKTTKTLLKIDVTLCFCVVNVVMEM